MSPWSPNTIVRLWRGRATPANAAAYARHVTERVFPSLAGIPGHRGAYLLRRETEGQVEFLAVTLWASMEAVRQFAGDRPERAVVEPEARAILARYDDVVQHFELVYGSRAE